MPTALTTVPNRFTPNMRSVSTARRRTRRLFFSGLTTITIPSHMLPIAAASVPARIGGASTIT